VDLPGQQQQLLLAQPEGSPDLAHRAAAAAAAAAAAGGPSYSMPGSAAQQPAAGAASQSKAASQHQVQTTAVRLQPGSSTVAGGRVAQHQPATMSLITGAVLPLAGAAAGGTGAAHQLLANTAAPSPPPPPPAGAQQVLWLPAPPAGPVAVAAATCRQLQQHVPPAANAPHLAGFQPRAPQRQQQQPAVLHLHNRGPYVNIISPHHHPSQSVRIPTAWPVFPSTLRPISLRIGDRIADRLRQRQAEAAASGEELGLQDVAAAWRY
jgi:hypothetical protein